MTVWAYRAMTDPEFFRFVRWDPGTRGSLPPGSAAAAWPTPSPALSWSGAGPAGDIVSISPLSPILSPRVADELGLSRFGDLLPLTIEGAEYLFFDCTVTVPEVEVVHPSAARLGRQVVLVTVVETPPRDAPEVFRVEGQGFLVWTDPMARRLRRCCAGAVVSPWGHAS